MSTPDRQTLYPNLKRGGAASSAKGADIKHASPKWKPPWKAGQSGNPNGRPKGVPNLATQQIKTVARTLVSDPIGLATLQDQYRKGQLPPPVLCMLFHYAFGKPKERIELDAKLETLTFVIASAPPLADPNPPKPGALALSAPAPPEEPEEPEEPEDDERPEEPPDEGAG